MCLSRSSNEVRHQDIRLGSAFLFRFSGSTSLNEMFQVRFPHFLLLNTYLLDLESNFDPKFYDYRLLPILESNSENFFLTQKVVFNFHQIEDEVISNKFILKLLFFFNRTLSDLEVNLCEVFPSIKVFRREMTYQPHFENDVMNQRRKYSFC